MAKIILIIKNVYNVCRSHKNHIHMDQTVQLLFHTVQIVPIRAFKS